MGHIHGVGGPARRVLMLRAAKTSVCEHGVFLVGASVAMLSGTGIAPVH
jgi:hypothetical protein